MAAYPQLAQFPIVKRMRRRTVVNLSADGRSIKLADPAGEITEWQLRYSDLKDDEAGTLLQFFEDMEGALNTFTFVDPTANLFAWSATLDESAWVKGPLLAVNGGPEEWRLTNGGAGPQALTQTISAPTGYIYCFSVSARADRPTEATMVAGSARSSRWLNGEWQRIRWSGVVDETTFGVEIPAGVAVDVRDLQVEAQAGASGEKTTTRGGVYEGARFRDDALEIIATGVNRNSCTVNIVHAIHI